MKKITLFIAGLFILTLSYSQEENIDLKNDEIKTLLGSDQSVGGYASIDFNYTEINGEQGLALGAKGAVIIGHSFAMGLGGSGFFNNYTYDSTTGMYSNIEGGYGGIFFEPIILPKLPIHISIPVLFGVGGVAYVNDAYYTYDDWGYVEDSDAFVIVEPGVQIEANLLKFLRLSIGATYRYTSDIHLKNSKKDVLNGLTTGISFKFGSF